MAKYEKKIAELLNTGVPKPNMSSIFPFEQLPVAHTAIEAGRTKGKIVVTIPDIQK